MEMRARFDEQLTLHDMAETACLSLFHFNRVFHQTTGITPTQFLYALRIESAKHLLLTTSRSVTDICYDVGYSSQGTFTYRFTRLVGLSPVRFREMALQSSGSLDPLLKSERKLSKIRPHLCAHGCINSKTTVSGPIFVGLFGSRIPEGHPRSGTVLRAVGPYYVGPLPEGKYYILAAALPRSNDPISYWLPDIKSLLVGAGETPLLVQNNKPVGKVDLMLRPAVVTDPPILVALPALIAGEFSARGTAPGDPQNSIRD